MIFDPALPHCCALIRIPATAMATGIVADLQDAVARAVTTALRDRGYVVDSEDEADSARLVHS